MSKYRKVDPRIWNDAKFRALSDGGKLVFFFTLTHPHMTSLGAMRSSLPGLAAELGWEGNAFTEAFREALSKGMVKHDPDASFLWLPNFIKYNPPESPNVVKAWVSASDLLPECRLKAECLRSVKAFVEGLSKGFTEVLPKGFAKDYTESGAGTGAGIGIKDVAEPGLNEVPVRKPAKSKKTLPAKNPPGEFVIFRSWWLHVFGVLEDDKYVFEAGKDGSCLSSMLKLVDLKELVCKACHFLTDKDRFPAGRPTLSLLKTAINKYPGNLGGKADLFRSMGLLPPDGVMLEEWQPWDAETENDNR